MELFRLLCGSSNHVSISQRTLDHVTDPSYSSTLAFLLSEQIPLQLRRKQQSNVYTTTALLRLFRTAIFNGAKNDFMSHTLISEILSFENRTLKARVMESENGFSENMKIGLGL